MSEMCAVLIHRVDKRGSHAGPKGRWSEKSLVRKVVGPKGRWSETSLVRKVVGPKGRWSENTLVHRISEIFYLRTFFKKF